MAGETLLGLLGIDETCKLILDHTHLISDDMGAWPKEFGLTLWATLKADLTLMVKSTHDAALDRVRTKLQSNPKWSSYLEDNIHAKRHLFANHIIKPLLGI